MIGEGQRYWIKLSGTLENGAAHSFYAAQNLPVTAPEVANGLSKAAERSELLKLKHGTPLKVEVRVAFDQGTDEAAARLFPGLELTVRKLEDLVLPAPEIPLATGDQLPPEDVPATGLRVIIKAYKGMAPQDSIVLYFGAQRQPLKEVTENH
ncbi:hypothetical protein KU43P_17590 [Pseudomonas sp. KU43P]|nr:hypothetical protein KU43P_17590 [Pseudomonas sp. KU43P]